jgi:DNA-binding NarL/FixJ family response regulator
MNREPVKVLCVDDHVLLADGLQARLSLADDIEFVGWLESAEHLVREARALQARVVLLDIEMQGPDSFEVVDALRRELPEIRVIMFSAHVRDHYIDEAVTRGAWGYLSKSDDPDEIVDAIRRVAQGEFGFSSAVIQRFQPSKSAKTRPASRLNRLTSREVQILRMIGKGMTRVEIATSLFRSPKTIDNHRAAIMEKLDIHDAVDLARFAIREGLVEA